MRGRQMAHSELGLDVMKRFSLKESEVLVVDDLKPGYDILTSLRLELK